MARCCQMRQAISLSKQPRAANGRYLSVKLSKRLPENWPCHAAGQLPAMGGGDGS
jgi:hypothetical protein